MASEWAKLLVLFEMVDTHWRDSTTVPLSDENNGESITSPFVRLRTATVRCEDGDAKSAHLRINMDQDQQKRIKTQMFSCTSSMSLFGTRSLVSQQRDCLWFLWIPADLRFNAELSLRVACGVILASLIQIRSPKYVPSMKHEKQWLFFPEWYYLGGLSYCEVAVIFCAGKNVGRHSRKCVKPSKVSSWRSSTTSFSFPSSLTIVNPTSPLDASKLKATSDSYLQTSNILNNLAMYFLLGFVGSLISLLIMTSATVKLREETTKASGDVLDLLNVIVDSYCFKNKNVEHLNFLKLKLQRKFHAAHARHRRMLALLENVWWEVLFGFHFLFHLNRSISKGYVWLIGSLLADLQSLNTAIQLEQYDHLHFQYMKIFQREIYMIQMRCGDLLHEISDTIYASSRHTTLRRYRDAQIRLLQSQELKIKDVEGNVPLNLFLFSLHSFCCTLIEYQG
ncbi:hypothetical protein PsorP6_012217 [Peronosclerospora sorghi]|uniref:Uncharacterized protein n=1 Tax=Peronosclerospora sorghi TaxID=230839 RepID=A0ACC0WIE8_9STRA|nr:hypothetical protein PsorP6_012217 [Peronosclerospora sorghi]